MDILVMVELEPQDPSRFGKVVVSTMSQEPLKDVLTSVVRLLVRLFKMKWEN